MTDIPTIARENASTIEVKKHAYRQTQDGIVISFVMNPNDVTAALATAALGTRYMAALVEIGDDEQPVEQTKEALATPRPAPAKEKRIWDDMEPAQQAGILCSDPQFMRFLYEEGHITTPNDETEAADAVRSLCRVQSRKDIAASLDAKLIWRDLVAHFRAWQMVPV